MSTLSIRPYADTASPSSPTTPAALRRATVSAVLLSPSNPRQLVVAATDGKVRLWDYLEGRLLRTLELGAPVLHATANAALPDQLFVALGTASGTPGEASVYLVSLRAAKHLVDGVVSAADPTTPVQPARRVRLATPRVVRALALSPDGAVLASLNPRAVNLARTADIQRGFTQSVPAAGDDEVLTTIAFHPSENYFATGNAKGQIRLWYDVLGGGAGATEGAVAAPSTSVLHWHAHAVSALAFTPNGAYLLSGGLEAVLVLWQLHSGHQEYVPRLGAPVVTLTVLDGTRDNPEQQVAARLGDGSVVFVGSQRLKVGKTISGLKAGASLPCLFLWFPPSSLADTGSSHPVAQTPPPARPLPPLGPTPRPLSPSTPPPLPSSSPPRTPPPSSSTPPVRTPPSSSSKSRPRTASRAPTLTARSSPRGSSASRSRRPRRTGTRRVGTGWRRSTRGCARGSRP